MTRILVILGMLLVAGVSNASGAADSTSACPLAPPPATADYAGCHYPSITVNTPSPSQVVVGSGTASVTWTVRDADPSLGCDRVGGWSGHISTDASGNANGTTTVGPYGSTGTFNLAINCPADPAAGTGSTSITVVNSSGGGGPPPPPPPPPPGCTADTDSAQFVAQSVPTSVNTGQTFTITEQFKNTGVCTWTAGGPWRLGTQNPENNTTWGLNRIYLAANVAPGAIATLTANLTAPATAGTYNLQWRMVWEGVHWLGTNIAGQGMSVNVAISVAGTNTGPTACDDGIDPACPPQINADTTLDNVVYQYDPTGRQSTCRTAHGKVTFKNYAGVLMWIYHEDVKWCWRRSGVISYVNRSRYGEKKFFLWEFVGHIGNSCNSETCSELGDTALQYGWTTVSMNTQGKFHTCVPYTPLCLDRTPYIQVTVQGGGTGNAWISKWFTG